MDNITTEFQKLIFAEYKPFFDINYLIKNFLSNPNLNYIRKEKINKILED